MGVVTVRGSRVDDGRTSGDIIEIYGADRYRGHRLGLGYQPRGEFLRRRRYRPQRGRDSDKNPRQQKRDPKPQNVLHVFLQVDIKASEIRVGAYFLVPKTTVQ